jgi:hypothetical protein
VVRRQGNVGAVPGAGTVVKPDLPRYRSSALRAFSAGFGHTSALRTRWPSLLAIHP